MSPRPLVPTVALSPILQLEGSGLEHMSPVCPAGKDLPTSLLLCAGPEARLRGAL